MQGATQDAGEMTDETPIGGAGGIRTLVTDTYRLKVIHMLVLSFYCLKRHPGNRFQSENGF